MRSIPLWPWPLTLTFCIDITSVDGNNSWKFQDDTMTRTLSKRSDRQTHRQTDGRTEISVLRAAWSQLKINSLALLKCSPILGQLERLHSKNTLRHPMITHTIDLCHDIVIKWKHCPRYRPFVQGIHPTQRPLTELWCFLWSAPE